MALHLVGSRIVKIGARLGKPGKCMCAASVGTEDGKTEKWG